MGCTSTWQRVPACLVSHGYQLPGGERSRSQSWHRAFPIPFLALPKSNPPSELAPTRPLCALCPARTLHTPPFSSSAW